MSDMALKIQTLWPEIVLTTAAFAVMLIGLSPSAAARRAVYPISAAALLLAAIVAAASPAMLGAERIEPMALFIKVAVCLIGLLLLATVAELPDETGADPGAPGEGRAFDPADASRGEFFGFFLLSLTGAMLCAGADDLIWLFLALELTSLPTYVMVATSRQHAAAPEASVKYFFLGALSAGVFLYGFALIYGATGTTMLPEIRASIADHGLSVLALVGIVLAIIGVCFKIAAVPMHFYAADVYQGAATPVTAFLAFTPKTAGFVTLILLLSAVGWPLDRSPAALDGGDALVMLLWVLAVATMFVGNTIALLQDNVKRVLAYSSIAHSGYMLVGLAAGPGDGGDGSLLRNGIAAVLFYLVAYGVMNLGAFAVLGVLKRGGEEAETFDDLRGLASRRPALAAVMAICVLSLTGLPPLVGFWGKLFLIGAAVGTGATWMVALAVLTVIASAIAAYYYLRIVAVCYLAEPTAQTQLAALPQRSLAAVGSAVGVVALSTVLAPMLVAASDHAAARAVPRAEQAAPVEASPPPAEDRAAGGSPARKPVRTEAASARNTQDGFRNGFRNEGGRRLLLDGVNRF